MLFFFSFSTFTGHSTREIYAGIGGGAIKAIAARTGPVLYTARCHRKTLRAHFCHSNLILCSSISFVPGSKNGYRSHSCFPQLWGQMKRYSHHVRLSNKTLTCCWTPTGAFSQCQCCGGLIAESNVDSCVSFDAGDSPTRRQSHETCELKNLFVPWNKPQNFTFNTMESTTVAFRRKLAS